MCGSVYDGMIDYRRQTIDSGAGIVMRMMHDASACNGGADRRMHVGAHFGGEM